MNDLFLREYDRQSYNCLHFAGEVWERLTGDGRLRQVREDEFNVGQMSTLFRGYRRVPGPTVEPSIVLMNAPDGEAHIGVCWRRRLFHINESGVRFLLFDAQAAWYRNWRFYA